MKNRCRRFKLKYEYCSSGLDCKNSKGFTKEKTIQIGWFTEYDLNSNLSDFLVESRLPRHLMEDLRNRILATDSEKYIVVMSDSQNRISVKMR